jgi:CRP/FNR family transcriptional regulator
MKKVPKTDTTSLKTIPLFQELSPAELNALRPHLKENFFDKGDMLFSEGDSCRRIMIVLSGRVKIFRTSASGREQILEVLESGDTCACHPGAAAWSCSSSAEALASSRILFLSREGYDRLVRTSHKATQKLNRIFAERLCRFSSLLEGVALDDPRRRIVKFILGMVKSHNGQPPAPVLSLTHEEIAMRIGLVRETVTRHLQQLKGNGLIDIQPRRIVVLDPEGLRKLL